jgi:hypothetical protein
MIRVLDAEDVERWRREERRAAIAAGLKRAVFWGALIASGYVAAWVIHAGRSGL